MQSFLKETGIPGAACAIVRNGKLLFARGYGYADREAKSPFLPTTACRIASVSKTVTAVAVMKLVEAGKLSLENSALKVSGLKPFLAVGTQLDPRVEAITIRDVLQHRTGFADRYWVATGKAKEMRQPSPLMRDQIVEYVLGTPLMDSPGTRHVYSNTNYCWLSRIIERVSGESYEAFVKREVWDVVGATDALTIRRKDATGEREARYYDLPDRREPSVFPEDKGALLPKSYGGGIDYRAVSGAGAWTCNVVDLARFATGLEGYRKRLLKSRSLDEIVKRPRGEEGAEWYGLGLQLKTEGRTNGGFLFGHTGGMSGSLAMIQSRWDGSRFFVVANGNNDEGNLYNKVIGPLHDAIDLVASADAWSRRDLFSGY